MQKKKDTRNCWKRDVAKEKGIEMGKITLVHNIRRGNFFSYGNWSYIKITNIDAQNFCILHKRKISFPGNTYSCGLRVSDDSPKLGFFAERELVDVIDYGPWFAAMKFPVKEWIYNAVIYLHLNESEMKNGMIGVTKEGPTGLCGSPGIVGSESKGTSQGPIGTTGDPGPVGLSMNKDSVWAKKIDSGLDKGKVKDSEWHLVIGGKDIVAPPGVAGPTFQGDAVGPTGPHDKGGNSVEMCPIENMELWDITPPLQRKEILKLQEKQLIRDSDKKMVENMTKNLKEVENNLKIKSSPENSMSYWGLTSPIRKKKEIEDKKFVDKFLPKKAVLDEEVKLENGNNGNGEKSKSSHDTTYRHETFMKEWKDPY
jgi:hypothetical protein